MTGKPVDTLLRVIYREIDTGQEVEAARVDGWIVWDSDGNARVVEPGEFERAYRRSETNA